jgi:hypothetical protein
VRFKASASRCLASARRWSPPCGRWLPQIKEPVDDSRRLLQGNRSSDCRRWLSFGHMEMRIARSLPRLPFRCYCDTFSAWQWMYVSS